MKKILSQDFGNTEIFFTTEDAYSDILIEQQGKIKGTLKVKQTSASETVVKKVNNIRSDIKELIIGFGSDIDQIKDKMKAKSLELEFSIAISAEGKLIIGAKAEGTLSFKITWEK